MRLLETGFDGVDRRRERRIQNCEKYRGQLLSFGMHYLDQAMRGILPQDLILVGASSGAGKTQFCVNMALRNVESGRRVHMIALEAEQNEIEQRFEYGLLARAYFDDPTEKPFIKNLNYLDWVLGKFDDKLSKYESIIRDAFDSYKTFETYYKTKDFGLPELVQSIYSVAEKTDLIIVDHVHYFDLDDDNENRALKQIAKTVRDVVQNIGKPVVLVAHLRKRDRRFSPLVPELDDFHGSSDLGKICTKAITLARGEMIDRKRFETYVRIPKCRIDGSVTQYVAKTVFSLELNAYEKGYQIGQLTAGGTEFEEFNTDNEHHKGKIPHWAKRA